MEKKYIIEVLAYSPRIYSRLDREIIEIVKKLASIDFVTVCVYEDPMEYVKAITVDIEKAGGIVECLPNSSRAQQWIAMKGIIEKYKPTIIHTHFCRWLQCKIALYSHIYNIETYTHIRSEISMQQGQWTPWQHLKYRLLYIILQLFNEKTICLSERIKSEYIKLIGFASSKLLVMYPSVDVVKPYSKQYARSLLGLSSTRLIVANISAIEHIKGIDLIIRAVTVLKRKGVDVLFVHIGGLRSETQENIDYAESLKHLAVEEGVEDRVIWLGKRFDVQDILSAFDVYVHPSRQEGLGSALLEASVAGLPLVGSKVGGIPEVVLDGENGYLFDNESVEQLADILQKFADNEELRLRMGKAAQERVSNMFDMDKQTDKIIKLYLQENT